MFARTALPLVATTLLVVVPVLGCGSGNGTTSQATRPGEYLTAVQMLLDPATRLAEAVTADLREPGGVRPRRNDLIDLVTAARRQLRKLQGLSLPDRVRDMQRDRIVMRFPAIISLMRTLVDDLVGGDRDALRRNATAYFRQLRTLPSALDDSSRSG